MYRETKKFWLNVAVLFLLLLFWLILFQQSRGNVIVLDDFDDGKTVLNWSSNKVSTTPSGRSFLGPFGAETIMLILPMPDTYFSAYITLDVYTIGVWEPFDPWHPVFPLPFTAKQYLPSRDSTQALIDGDLMSLIRRTETDTLGYAEPNRVYHYRQPFTGTEESWYEVSFTGTVDGMQWGLDNVEVYYTTPEPSTGTTVAVVLGILFALWCWWRLRQISRTDTYRAENSAFRQELWLESQKDKGDY